MTYLLIPEGEKKRPMKKAKDHPVVVIAKSVSKLPEPPKPPVPPAKPKPEKKYTLAAAFNFLVGPFNDEDEKTFNVERALRAVAFLMHWSTDVGNHALDGNAANGLAYILEKVASEVARHPAPASIIRYVYGGSAPKDEPNTPEAS